jgi:selenocysteine lyase/cysteine desulfurase
MEHEMDWSQVRALFPAAERYTYLNTAAAPPISLLAAREGKRYYDEMAEHADVPWDRWLSQVEDVREKLAKLLHAEPQSIAFTYSTAHGMNLIAGILQHCGDVLCPADEFPSCTLPWLQQRYRLHFVRSQDRGVIDLEDVERSITPETRILVASYVQFATGFRQDLVSMGRLCSERKLIFVVDATQGMGVFPIDVVASNIDFLVFSGYKWAQAGYGVGGLYIAPRFLNTSSLPVAGWWSVRDPEAVINDRLDLKETAAALEVGCPHFAGIFALGGALALFEEIGAVQIEERIHQLTDYLHQRLDKEGLKIASPRIRDQRSGITIIEMRNASEVVKSLAEKKIIVSARGKGLRVSVHVFNNFDDIDHLVAALPGVSVLGHRARKVRQL